MNFNWRQFKAKKPVASPERVEIVACRCQVCGRLWHIEKQYTHGFRTKNHAGEFVFPCIGPDGLVHDNWKNFTKSALYQ